MKLKKLSPYYQFMEPYFTRGDDTAIQKAKEEYRRMYKAQWKKEKRRKDKEIAVGWTKAELKELTSEAKRHSQSLVGFIKKATISYMSKVYLVANKAEIDKVLQLVKMMYLRIENLVDEQEIDRVMGIEIKEELFKLEREVRIALISPYTLEQSIQKAIERNPDYRTELLDFIKNLNQ